MTQLFGGKFSNSKICIINLIKLLSCSIEFHPEKFLSLFLFQCTVLILKLTSHKDSYFLYNCLHHIIVFPIEMWQKRTNSVLFSPINDFELQITKLRDIYIKNYRYFFYRKNNRIKRKKQLSFHDLSANWEKLEVNNLNDNILFSLTQESKIASCYSKCTVHLKRDITGGFEIDMFERSISSKFTRTYSNISV